MFRVVSYTRIDLDHFDDDDGRHYYLPDGSLVDSVTTRLYKHKDFNKNKHLTKWKKHVGQEKADQISVQARNRGNAIHKLCEEYLLNNPDYAKKAMPINLSDFGKIKRQLDDNVTIVNGIEIPLYSYQFNTAGKADLLCTWNNKKTIVDFKTSRKIKAKKDILGYFVQASCYGLMASEMYLPVEQIVVILSVDHSEPQVFVENIDDYKEIVRSVFCPEKLKSISEEKILR